jgi:hypothetical protein
MANIVDLGFTEVWHCPQPETYKVIRERWVNDYTERHIYEVQTVPDGSGHHGD